jgi:hypothetical protein
MPFIVATYVYASSQGQRTHSARTNFCWQKSNRSRREKRKNAVNNGHLVCDSACKPLGPIILDLGFDPSPPKGKFHTFIFFRVADSQYLALPARLPVCPSS